VDGTERVEVDVVGRNREGAEDDEGSEDDTVLARGDARSGLDENGNVETGDCIVSFETAAAGLGITDVSALPVLSSSPSRVRVLCDIVFCNDFPLTISNNLEEPLGGECTFLNFQRTAKSPETSGTFVIWWICSRT
jgi:hypothetical protein